VVPLLLVRHAQAKPRKDWDGDDGARPLSPHGLRQAEGLVAIMGNFAPRARVLSSPSLRCLQTVGPVASAQHLSVEETDDLVEGQSSVAVRLVRAVAGQEVVVCTHGDVIAEILVALADEDRLDLGQNPRQAKGSVWALDGRKGSFTSAKYYAPVVVDAT
jgi:8-oxo-dGTP diphosphatase